MRLAGGLIALAVIAAAVETSASTLFFSTSATSPTEKLTSSNATFNVARGTTFSVYIWADMTTGQRISGLGHDIVSNNPNVTRADGAVWYFPDNPQLGGADRWNTVFLGDNASSLLLDNANFVRIGGSSLGFGTTNDPTYDPTTATYRVGRIDLKAVTLGSSELRMGIGSGGISFTGQPSTTTINFGFGDTALAGDDARRNSSTALSTLPEAIVNIKSPWQNPLDPLNVDPSAGVEPLDALVIFNRLNEFDSQVLDNPTAAFAPPPYYDVDGDGALTPLDGLVVVNFLNEQSLIPPNIASFEPQQASVMAVPEPSAAALLCCGLAAIACVVAGRRGMCRRRSRGCQASPAL